MASWRMTLLKNIRRDQRHTSCPVAASSTSKSYVWPDLKLKGRSLSDVLMTVNTNLVPPGASEACTSRAGLSSDTLATLSASALVFCSGVAGAVGGGSVGAP